MNYTPDPQRMREHIDKILEGINGFNSAYINKLVNNGEWTTEHIDECREIVGLLHTVQYRLVYLKGRTP